MGKRYYIEVTEDCAGELERMGAVGGSIMVVDDAAATEARRRHGALIRAIEELTGVTAERITGKERTRYAVLARTIYAHYARIDGATAEQLEHDMGSRRRYVNYVLADFAVKMEGDLEFRKAEGRVRAILEADPQWSPPRVEKAQHAKRKRGRGRRVRKGRGRPAARRKEGRTAARGDSLQYEIEF